MVYERIIIGIWFSLHFWFSGLIKAIAAYKMIQTVNFYVRKNQSVCTEILGLSFLFLLVEMEHWSWNSYKGNDKESRFHILRVIYSMYCWTWKIKCSEKYVLHVNCTILQDFERNWIIEVYTYMYIYIYCVVYIEICSALPDELSIYLYLATQVVYIISTYMHMGYSFLYGAHMQVNCSRVEWIIGNIFCFCWLHSEARRPSRIVLDVRAGRLFLFLHLSLLVKNEEPEWCVSGIQIILSAVQSIFRRALISVLRKELDEKKRFLSNSHSNPEMFWK